MKDILAKSYWVLLATLTALIFVWTEPPFSLMAVSLLLLLEVSAQEKHFANAFDSVNAYVCDVRTKARDLATESEKTVAKLKTELERRISSENNQSQ